MFSMKNLKARKSSWMPVVAGLLQREGHVLLGLRPGKDPTSGFWEFPGGKLEPGESPETALQRELLEELGVQAKIGSIAFATTHQYESLNILLLFFHVTQWKGEIKKNHHQDLKWVAKEDLKQTDLLPANKKCLTEILKVL